VEQVDSLRTGKKFKKTEIDEIPVDWEVADLSEVISSYKNGIWGDDPTLDEKSYPIIRSTEISHDGKLDLSSVAFRKIPEAQIRKYKLQDNDILLVASSGSPNLIGRSALFKQSHDKRIFLFSNFMVRIRPEKINHYFLFYFLNSQYYHNFLTFLQQTSTGLRNLPKKEFIKMKLPIPPLPEQKKIAEILTSVDQAIEKSDQVIEKTKELKKGLMQELLTCGIGRKKFKKTKIGEIPVEWEIVYLKNILTVLKNGTTKKQNTLGIGYPVTRIETISSGIIDYKKVGYVEDTANLADYKLQQGDILLSHINSIKHIGKIARFDSAIELYHGMNLLLLRFKKKIDSLYVYYILSLESAKKYFETHAKPAVNQASLNQKEIGNFILSLATLPEQKKISKILSTVDEDIERAVDNKKKLETIKKGLMQVLLTGKVRVRI
jgi:type I restriction enzyme S subunit